MANPLRWFRRHQKIMMVFFGAILMAVFGLGSVVSMIDPSRNADEETKKEVVKWVGGSLNRGQLDQMRLRHAQVLTLQRAIMEEGFQRNKNFNQFGMRLIRPINLRATTETVDKNLFERIMLAQYAQENLGLTATDAIVDDYFQMIAMTPLSARDVAAINNEVNGTRASLQQIRDQMKIEILAMRAEDMIEETFLYERPHPYINIPGAKFRNSEESLNTLEAFQDYRRLKQTIECKVVKFPVDNYLDKAELPGDAELRKIYEKGKSSFPDPRGIRPGFKIRRKLSVEYVNANRQDFLQLVTQNVTREEVEAEYDRLVKEKHPLVIAPVLPSIDGFGDGTEPLQDPTEKKAEDGAEKAGDAATDDKKPEGTDDKKPEGTDDKKPEGEANESGNATGKTEESNTDPKEKADDSKKDSDQGLIRNPGRTVYTSLRPGTQDEQENETADPPPAATGTAEPKQDEPKQDEPKQDEPKQDEPKQDEPKQDSAAPQDGAGTDPVVTPKQDEVKFKPLDAELAQTIKESMKRIEADEALATAIRTVEAEMQKYNIKFYQWENTKDGPQDQRLPKPDPIDLQKLAAENHMTHGTTRVVDVNQLGETKIGRVRLEFQGGDGQRVTFSLAQQIFSQFDETDTYNGRSAPDGRIGAYAYWITEKVDVRIPTFEECKNEVEDYWKSKEAVKLALDAAEKAAREATSTGQSLAEKFKTTVEDTGEFSWFETQFDRRVGYGNPSGVNDGGEKFMTAAFGLDLGEIGFAPNATNTEVYLIEVTNRDSRTIEDLFTEFKSEIERFQQLPVNVHEVNRIYNDTTISKMLRMIYDDFEVAWQIY